MEVLIPHVQSQFDFCNPAELANQLDENINGSNSHQLAQYLEIAIHSLRTEFSSYNIPNLEEYFDASRDQVRCTLEWIWFDRFDISEYKRKFLKLEAMKKDAETKLEDFKREIDELPFWRKAVLHYDSAFARSLEETEGKNLDWMWPRLKEIYDLYNQLNSHCKKTAMLNQMKLNRRIGELSKYDGQVDAEYCLKITLHERQQRAIRMNLEVREELITLQNKIEDIRVFRIEWYKWFHGQLLKDARCTLGLGYATFGARFFLHVNNLDPVRLEAVDVSQFCKDDLLIVVQNTSNLLSLAIG